MKRFAFALAIAFCAAALSAAPVDMAALQKYVKRALPSCPGSLLSFDKVQDNGPAGFEIYVANLSSTDKNCSARKYVLVSPETEQIIIGQVFILPAGATVPERLRQKGTDLLKEPVEASVERAPLPDGLRAFTITKQTSDGPFSYHGYVDATQNFMIIGFRGNLRVDPGKTLVDFLVGPYAVHRGNPKAKTQIVEMSDLQCPTCARAHHTLEPTISKSLSKIDYVRVDLPLFQHHEWSLRAALGARAIQRVAPKQYWPFVNFVFENQETIGKQDFDKVLHDFSEDHQIDWSAVETLYKSEAEKRILVDQVSRAFDIGIVSTPTFIVNGQQVGFAAEGKYTMDTIEKAAQSAQAVKVAKK
jgi:protein-disulfide isomerase